MASVNKPIPHEVERTHGGAVASRITAVEILKRSVMANMLWEDNFYEDGESVAKRIADTLPKVSENDARTILYASKEEQHLRHTPLYLLCLFAKQGWLKKDDVVRVCTRVDDMTELLALYWSDGKDKPLPKQMVKGLQIAFKKFDEYQLAKYNRKKEVKLRDVLRITRPKPDNDEQSELWNKVLNNNLKTPDTWEVAISVCKTDSEKKVEWERLIDSKSLGGLATLRNLRNMQDVKVDPNKITTAIKQANYNMILPFQFTSAVKYAPRYLSVIEDKFLENLSQKSKLKGKSIIVIDVSGSMYGSPVSKDSDMDRAKAASTLAAIMREICEDPVIYATGGNDGLRLHKTKVVPSYKGFALVDAVYNMKGPLGGGGIFLKQVCEFLKEKEQTSDRMIVFTDEQDCDIRGSPSTALPVGDKGYIINVGTYNKGIAYTKNWLHISGFSEACVDYIIEAEK
jgi:hypothetical protein